VGWTFESAHAQQWNGSEYVEDDWEMAAGGNRHMQFYFSVDGTSFGDPIAAGDFTMQVDEGAGYRTWQSLKNISPDRNVGLASIQGDRVIFAFRGVYVESTPGVYPIRLKVDWTGGPYYSNVVTATLTGAQFFEGVPPPGTYTETDPPDGTWLETDSAAGTWAETDKPSGGFAETATPTGSWAETTPATGTWEETDKPSGGFSETATPTGTWTETDKPSGGFSETTTPSGTWTETDKPSGSWTENE